MRDSRLFALTVASLLLAAGCAKRPPAPPPAPPAPPPAQNVFALLPDPDGRETGIVVSNSGGSRAILQPNQAVRVEREGVQPTDPFPVDQATVTRLFGSALAALPAAEARFVLYFDEASETLNAQAQAMMPEILSAIRERRSTDISVTGHTDTTGTSAGNYQLGLRRAERVAAVLRAQGVEESSLFVTSHGESDPLVKTGPRTSEQRNRRVEVIVH